MRIGREQTHAWFDGPAFALQWIIERKSRETMQTSSKSAEDAKRSADMLEHEELRNRMSQIRFKIMVMSGKGGVGKSTVAANLAISLAHNGHYVGLLDVDIHGPSIPKLLKLEGRSVDIVDQRLLPVRFSDNLQVVSIGFMLGKDDEAVIWRGPMKMNLIKQFLKDVQWDSLDFLVIDSPPGTGDEPLSICQLIGDVDGAVIVTTPQELALADVRKSINFCRKLNLRVLGVIENMSGFVCPECGAVTNIFAHGGGERMAREMAVPFLGRIPLDRHIAEAGDKGNPYIHQSPRTEAVRAFEKALQPIVELSHVNQAKGNREKVT